MLTRTLQYILGVLMSLTPLVLASCSGNAPGSTASQTGGETIKLLNVSYDPTRELWRELNAAFVPQYEQDTGNKLKIEQSHGGSSSQARAVIDGLDADVVTLATWQDTDAIRRAGLIDKGWEQRLSNGSLPYQSTIVFVVRKGNPKSVRDWPDLLRHNVQVITPNPKTSGNGKLSFLAAWGSVTQRGGSEEDAKRFVTELYRHVPVLDSGARAATTTFAQKGLGDVHLTWENEAHLEVREAKGELELVYPPISVLAEPLVAWVDKNVKRKGTAAAAKAYLEFLYKPEAQDIIAKNFYRPVAPDVAQRFAGQFPKIEWFSVQQLAGNWDQTQARFFADGAVFDQIYSSGK